MEDLLKLSSNKSINYVVDKERLRPIDADLQIPNTYKFVKKTGWKPEISYQKTLEDLLNYWRRRIKIEGNTFLQR